MYSSSKSKIYSQFTKINSLISTNSELIFIQLLSLLEIYSLEDRSDHGWCFRVPLFGGYTQFSGWQVFTNCIILTFLNYLRIYYCFYICYRRLICFTVRLGIVLSYLFPLFEITSHARYISIMTNGIM
jgi:hypothetical protein